MQNTPTHRRMCLFRFSAGTAAKCTTRKYVIADVACAIVFVRTRKKQKPTKTVKSAIYFPLDGRQLLKPRIRIHQNCPACHVVFRVTGVSVSSVTLNSSAVQAPANAIRM